MGFFDKIVREISRPIHQLTGGGGGGGGGGDNGAAAAAAAAAATRAQAEKVAAETKRQQEAAARAEATAAAERARVAAAEQERCRQAAAAAEQQRRNDEQRRQQEAQRKAKQQRQAEAQRQQQEAQRLQREAAAREAENQRKADELRRIQAEKKAQQDKADARVAAEMKHLADQGFDSVCNFNVAFPGGTGRGKSTLVAMVMGKTPNSDGSPTTGAGAECTLHTTLYSMPHTNNNVQLADLAGGGTERHPAETYCADKCLKEYNAVVMAFSSRFTELDIDIVKYSLEQGKPLAVVYTKVDADVYSASKPDPSLDGAAFVTQLRSEARAKMIEDLVENGVAAEQAEALPFFCVDSLSWLSKGQLEADYDGSKVIEWIVRRAAESKPQDERNADNVWADYKTKIGSSS